MEFPELSLAPTQFVKNEDYYKMNCSTTPKLAESNCCSKKRKLIIHDDYHLNHHHYHIVNSQTSVDLQLNDPLPLPLPLHWEQCLDLQSGKMYYLNRKTLMKSWHWPKDQDNHNYHNHNHNHDYHHQKLVLELELNNINNSSSYSSNSSKSTIDHNNLMNLRADGEYEKSGSNLESSCNNNMVALPCLNCHLLVILSKSSPSCPNCKHLHTLFPPPSNSSSPISPPNTLSLLN